MLFAKEEEVNPRRNVEVITISDVSIQSFLCGNNVNKPITISDEEEEIVSPVTNNCRTRRVGLVDVPGEEPDMPMKSHFSSAGRRTRYPRIWSKSHSNYANQEGSSSSYYQNSD